MVLAALTVLGVIFSPLIVRMFSMFGKNQVQIEAVYLNRLMFPYILFIGMAALAMGILNCFHVFGLPAATPILLNISFIVFSTAVVWRYFSSPAAALAVGVLVGGIFQFFSSGAATGSPGNEFSIWRFVFGSGSAPRGAPDGSGFYRDRDCAD